jgi:hypothetical protein
VQHVDPVRGGERQVLEVLVRKYHDVAGGELVALGHVGVRHFLAVYGTHPAILNSPAVLAVHLPERDVTLLGRRVELDRDHDHPE